MNLTSSEKAITKEVMINAPIELVWHAWTNTERVKEWFAPVAVVEPKIGGKFEVYFIPGNIFNMNTRGCKITKIEPQSELEFTWKSPDDFAHIMNNEEDLTLIHVKFKAIDESTTKVTLTHSRFKNSPDWEEPYNWHVQAWETVVTSLKSHLEQKE